MALPTAQKFLPPGTSGEVCRAYNQALKRTAIALKAYALGYRSDLTDQQMDEAAEEAGQRKPASPSTRQAIRNGLKALEEPITDDTDPMEVHRLMQDAVASGTGVGVRRWNGRTVLLVPIPIG